MNRIRTFLQSVSAPEDAPSWSLTNAIVIVVLAFAAMIFASIVVLTWVGNQGYTELAGWTLGGLLIFLFVWQTRRSDWAALRLTGASAPLLFVMFVSLGSAITLDLISLAVTQTSFAGAELQWLNLKALGVLQWAFAIGFMVIVQPVVEELIFRGILLPALRTRLGAWPSILVTALISGGFHMVVYPLNGSASLIPLWYGVLIPIIEAVIFGMVRTSTHSTRAAIASHAAFGLFAIAKLLTLLG